MFLVLQQAAETYAGYQGLLGLPADEFANLTAAEKEAEGRYAVWKTLLELQEKVIDWTTGPILSRQDNSVSPSFKYIVCADGNSKSIEETTLNGDNFMLFETSTSW